MSFRRDPVSELFDDPARRLLARAYAQPGTWVQTRLANPTPRHIAWAAGLGLNLLAGDNASTASGSHYDARSRWARGFVRAVYHQHRWHYAGGQFAEARRTAPNDASAIRVEVGRRIAAAGVIPAGRMIRVVSRTGGGQALAVVQAMGDDERIYDDNGNPAGRWSDPEGRDW